MPKIKERWQSLSKKRKLVITIVPAIVFLGAAVGGFQYHEQPQFCAVCHDAMGTYVDGYLDPESGLLSSDHAEAGVVCLQCHSDARWAIGKNLSELFIYLNKDYEIPLEKRVFPNDFCMKCHEQESRELAHFRLLSDRGSEFTQCSDCHTVHRPSTLPLPTMPLTTPGTITTTTTPPIARTTTTTPPIATTATTTPPIATTTTTTPPITTTTTTTPPIATTTTTPPTTTTTPPPTSGLAAEGRTLFVEKGCGICHTIQGIPEATATIGAELTNFASNSFTTGLDILPNTEAQLTEYLEDPTAEKWGGTVMPKQPLTDSEIEALVAFLQTLE